MKKSLLFLLGLVSVTACGVDHYSSRILEEKEKQYLFDCLSAKSEKIQFRVTIDRAGFEDAKAGIPVEVKVMKKRNPSDTTWEEEGSAITRLHRLTGDGFKTEFENGSLSAKLEQSGDSDVETYNGTLVWKKKEIKVSCSTN